MIHLNIFTFFSFAPWQPTSVADLIATISHVFHHEITRVHFLKVLGTYFNQQKYIPSSEASSLSDNMFSYRQLQEQVEEKLNQQRIAYVLYAQL